MKHTFICCLILITSKLYAQTSIHLKDVEKHYGDSVKIDAVIFGGKHLTTSKGTPTFLNIGAAYPDAPLTLVVWQDVRDKFKNTDFRKLLQRKKSSYLWSN